MNHFQPRWVSLVCVLVIVPTAQSEDAVKPIGQGELTSLSALPEKVVLQGAGQLQQLVITGHYGNGGSRDLTHQAVFRAVDPSVASVQGHGLVTARGNGSTEIRAEVQGKSVKIGVTVTGADREQPINFVNQIVPIFSKLGCNSGACHGKSTGQNGFRLSLLGFEPEMDYGAIVREARGRRIFLAAPEASLLLQKPTGAMPHGGGKRLSVESRDYQTLLRWIRSGAPLGRPTDPRVVSISVMPVQRLAPAKSALQIVVTATLSDGSRRDVTADAEYSSNNPEIADVSEGGVVQTQDVAGDGAILVRYLGHVGVFRVSVPQKAPLEKYTFPKPANFIDEHVYAKLKQLAVPPSERCSDSEFLRRVSLDITGTLPTAAEVEKFLNDSDPHKRTRLVEELLGRPTYASYFALKWSDILRNRRNVVGVPGKQERTQALHRWIRQSLLENKPYDQFVREILTAQGDYSGDKAQPPVAWFNVLRKPDVLVDDTAQVFLGTRLQCAQCHHHPYEKWGQDDYWGLAAFFARVQFADPKSGKVSDAKKPSPGASRVVLAASGQVTSVQGKVYSLPKALDGPELTIPAGEDPRQKLVDWMTEPSNPFFAKAIVNRYWAHFFGRGIVELPDDMRVSNPPSNPELLDALAQDFVKNKYDLKHLIRTICASNTYQASSAPNEHNARDKQNFARFYPRRLPAEVLFDAIDQVTGAPAKFVAPIGTTGGGLAKKTPALRAIDLPDEAVKTPLLLAFGKPARITACECERSSAATLEQSLYLVGSTELHAKLKSKGGRIENLAKDPRPVPEKVRELYLWVFARVPTAQELATIEAYLASGRRGTEAWEDVVWALLNTKEFLFNH